MKRKVTREVKIGLSILLLLTLILAGVIVRRAMWAASRDAEVARTEERHDEERHDGHDNHQPELFPKSALVRPMEPLQHDALHALDDPSQWKGDSKERKKEAEASAAAPPAVPIPTESAKPHHYESEHVTTYAPPELPPAGTYDRYGNITGTRPVEQRKPDDGKSMVIQVSEGESPRTLDPRATRENPIRPERPAAYGGDKPREGIPPVPFGGDASSAGRYSGATATGETQRRSEAERRREEKAQSDMNPAQRPKERDYRDAVVADAGAPRGSYTGEPAARERRNEYDPAAAGSMTPNYSRDPAVSPAANYGPPERRAGNPYESPGGYSPDRMPRDGAPAQRVGEEFARRHPQVPLRDDGMYEVQPNDSFWTISKRVYGSGAYFRALAEVNRGRAARPDRLQPSLLIATPPIARLEKDYPDLCPRPSRRDTVRQRAASIGMASTAGGGRSYVVQEGDTLTSIARHELGKVSRWPEIYQLNRESLGKDWDYLTPGMRLVLPIRDEQAGDRTTRHEDGVSR